MANWFAKVAATFRAVGFGKKVKPTPFDERNGKLPFNASGVADVGPWRFVFIDNHDPSALFELTLDADGAEVERISRRPLIGVSEGQLRDPEGLARVSDRGEAILVVASSLCVVGTSSSGRREVCDGLVRIRYRRHGDLHADAMDGFRDWLLRSVPTIAQAAEQEPDAGGLNVEGLAWQSNTNSLLLGLRGPAEPGIVTVIRIPVDMNSDDWTPDVLGTPSVLRMRLPKPKARQGIRDLSYDERTDELLVLVGRTTSAVDEPFQLCSWGGSGDTVRLLDVKFRRSMKPEGVVTFSGAGERRLLIVDDRGGYAVIGHPDDQ